MQLMESIPNHGDSGSENVNVIATMLEDAPPKQRKSVRKSALTKSDAMLIRALSRRHLAHGEDGYELRDGLSVEELAERFQAPVEAVQRALRGDWPTRTVSEVIRAAVRHQRRFPTKKEDDDDDV